MLNKIKILSVMTALVTAALAMDFAAVQAGEPGIKKPAAAGVMAQKKCERCARGPDNKMICTPVPCPK